MERKIDKELLLYGKGKLGKLAEEILGKHPHSIVDKDSICGNNGFGGVPKSEVLVAVCVATEPFTDIKRSLKDDHGYSDIVPIWDVIQAYPASGITNGWTWDNTNDDLIEVRKVASKWEDGWSWYHYQMFTLWHSKQGVYYDKPVVPWAPIVFDRWSPPEIVKAVHKKISRTASWHLDWKEGSTLKEINDRRRVVELDPERPHLWRYVRFHCEGKEDETVLKNLALLQKHRPIIGVTVYHNEDGLWKIEKRLMEALSDYSFYFRLHCHMGTGAVMYCIPKEAQ